MLHDGARPSSGHAAARTSSNVHRNDRHEQAITQNIENGSLGNDVQVQQHGRKGAIDQAKEDSVAAVSLLARQLSFSRMPPCAPSERQAKCNDEGVRHSSVVAVRDEIRLQGGHAKEILFTSQRGISDAPRAEREANLHAKSMFAEFAWCSCCAFHVYACLA